jgi:hypothetical protein
MMAVVKVSWEARDETAYSAIAEIKNTSNSGACIQLQVPIETGTKVHVSWCRHDFSGTARWCRAYDGEYMFGMQRDQVAQPVSVRNASRLNAVDPRQVEMTPALRIGSPRVRPVEAPSVHEVCAPAHLPLATEIVRHSRAQRPLIRRGRLTPVAKPEPLPLPLMQIAFPPAEIYDSAIGRTIAHEYMPRFLTDREFVGPGAPYQKRTTSLFEERTDMPNRWLNLGNRRQQKDGANGRNGSGETGGDTRLSTVRGDLSPLEDIYRGAGIVAPRMGYSITKVVEMLRSDHLRGLGDEVKRASVLMALSAAGVPLSDVLQDAAQRQAAVAAYEVEQRNKFEEYWSRRAEENSQLQTEMERTTRQFVERMGRNLAEVQQEKDAFQMWQHTMQYEVLQISAAVALCAQPTVFETATQRPAEAGGGQNTVAKSA